MTASRPRASLEKRVSAMADELERLGRPATRAELKECLPPELFPSKRTIDRTFREDQERPDPVLSKPSRNRYSLRRRSPDERSSYGSSDRPTDAWSDTPAEQSLIYDRGQTVVPKAIRDALHIEQGSTLVWEMQGGTVRVFPIPNDPVAASFGILKGKGPNLDQFLADRNAERERERRLEADEERRWRTYSTRRQR